MTTYICILRGINVGGNRVIKMDALKRLCIDLNLQHVKTYIQSGNIIFQCQETSTKTLSKQLQTAIQKTFGFDVPVISFSKMELESMIASNPFLRDNSKDPAFFHITFLSDTPKPAHTEQLKQIPLKNDTYALVDKAVYLYCPDGYSNSKLTNSLLENKLGVVATTRNWKTTNELLHLATQMGVGEG